ncbi:hypothetical protein SAMN02745164_00521 [Marinitoga hydrogenitolerans DSM 16785]|uniref:Fibronectin type-III domain-containing protein n=1 Tax=Marinitoga hydrogenitolerans (strain DSM 16785 / JCM 12826 / AT1271) TaxID=1122195 RepID=A0A1M4TVC0_MARH1|nr:hypothetical protein [Marinitoga hydrogenitolerans]SHE48386.1 hypothetical protein SAMN02745164_00521 [Marinitoga hydrogenitolerans DSM 16785]
MFEALNIDTNFLSYYRHKTKYKKILFYAKIDGVNWYDLSDYVQNVKTNNKIQLLNNAVIDTTTITVKNENNAFTSTQYNDAFDPVVGKINGTINDGYLNKVWEVKILVEVTDGINTIQIPIFHGWKTQRAIKEKHKKAKIELKDILWITTQKKIEYPLLYTQMTPNAIISDLLNRCGLDTSYQDLQSLTTVFDVFIAEKDRTYWQVIQKIVEATAGRISTTPEGKVIYRTRIENFIEPSPVITINQEDFKNYNLSNQKKYNRIKLESEGFEIGAITEAVIDTDLQGDNAIIAATKQGRFELEYTSDYIKNPDTTVFLTVYQGETLVSDGEAFTAGSDNGLIRLDELTAYPDKLILKITNLSSTVSYRIAHVKFNAIPIKKISLNNVIRPNLTNEPDAEISLKSHYSSEAMLSNVADVVENNLSKEINFNLQMNEFYPDVFAGNLVNLSIAAKGISSGVFIIDKVEHSLEANKFETKLNVVEWKNINFDISNKEITQQIVSKEIQKPNVVKTVEEISGAVQKLQAQTQAVDDRTNFLDRAEPSAPTNLALSTINENGLSFIKASWDANTETDLIGYELAWSYDGIDWNYIKTSETLVKFEVAGNKTVYAKVRALDAEGKKSVWSAVQQITSAKDEMPPAIPTGLIATGLFQKIQLKWNENTEDDFKEYELQVATDNTFTLNVENIKISATNFVYAGNTNTTYYFRIRAIDESGNISAWSAAVSGTTAKVYDSDLESQRLTDAENAINQNATDIATLNNSTIPNLQTDIQNNRTDIDSLNNTTIPTLQNDISNNQIQIDDLNNNTIPELNEKLSYKAIALPAGAIGYWTTSLLDDVNNIKPVGYDYVNLKSIIQVVEDNIPNGTITETKIADNSISTPKLQANSISSDKIIAGAITTAKIAAGAVTANEIAANSITATHIQTDAITAEKISVGAVIAEKIATGAILAEKIATGAITTAKIAAGAITANEIATSAITANKIAVGAVTADKISVSAVTAEKIAASAITSDKIATGAITAGKVAANAITANEIAAGAITADKIGTNEIITNTANIKIGIIQEAHIADAAIAEAKIQNAAITNAKIADLAVDDAKIANLNASKITTGFLDADRIEAGSITADKLIMQPAFGLPKGAIAYFTNSLVDEINQIMPVGYTEVNLAPTITLTPENAPAGSIIGDLMVADKIYANHLNVSELSAITANVGTLNTGVLQNSTGTTKLDLTNGTLQLGYDGTNDTNYFKYDGINLEIVGATLKLSSEKGEIHFVDSNINLFDSNYTGWNSITFENNINTQRLRSSLLFETNKTVFRQEIFDSADYVNMLAEFRLENPIQAKIRIIDWYENINQWIPTIFLNLTSFKVYSFSDLNNDTPSPLWFEVKKDEGIKLQNNITSDPTTSENGQLYYNSSLGDIKLRTKNYWTKLNKHWTFSSKPAADPGISIGDSFSWGTRFFIKTGDTTYVIPNTGIYGSWSLLPT